MLDNRIEYVIKNGHVVDPSQGIDRIADVAISHGRVVGIDIPCEPKTAINAEGCYVFPGLIDFHVHVGYGFCAIATNPDWMLSTGVTAVVDAGSSGYANFPAFLNLMNNSIVKIRCQLSTYSAGQIDEVNDEHYDDSLMFPDRIIDTCKKHRDKIIGLKIRNGKHVVGELGVEPIKTAIKLAEYIPGFHVCVHTSSPSHPMETIANLLRPGDIMTHFMHDSGYTILDENGHVTEEIKQARERGVIFDIGHGHYNFATNSAVKITQDGFWPDTISTDMTINKVGASKIVRSMPMIMSKFLALGMPLCDIVRAVTEKPAELMGMKDEIGTLKAGAIADVAIMRKEALVRDYPDSTGAAIKGSEAFVPQLTMANGQIVYSNEKFLCFD